MNHNNKYLKYNNNLNYHTNIIKIIDNITNHILNQNNLIDFINYIIKIMMMLRKLTNLMIIVNKYKNLCFNLLIMLINQNNKLY